MATPSQAKFDEIWLPRIGAEAAAELRRNSYLTLVVGPSVLVLAIISGVALGKATPEGSIVGALAILVGLLLCVVWTRSRLRFARALSKSFGIRVSIQGLPRMTARHFDAWCQRRNLSRAGS
jgi:predicted neutral ceramidase superfamily lipid hydrolase